MEEDKSGIERERSAKGREGKGKAKDSGKEIQDSLRKEKHFTICLLGYIPRHYHILLHMYTCGKRLPSSKVTCIHSS